MTTALAAQLAKGASINAGIINARAGGKPANVASFLFSAREAAEHDLDSILALAQNGLAQLAASVNSDLSNIIPASLFDSSSRSLDRTAIPPAERAQLDKDIALALRYLSPYLLLPPAAKCIEWLVRRFRVHEFNQDDVLACFLPYHDSVLFMKMATILALTPTSKWAFLHPYKTSPTPLSRTVIVNAMIKSSDLARFIVSLLPTALDLPNPTAGVHRSLIAFSTGALAEYITRYPNIDEGVIAFVLPTCVRMLEVGSTDVDSFNGAKDVTLAGAILIASLSHRCSLTPAALEVVLVAVTKARKVMGDTRTMQTVVAVLSPQDWMDVLPGSVVREIIRMESMAKLLCDDVPSWAGAEKTLLPLTARLLKKKFTSSHKYAALSALATSPSPNSIRVIKLITRALLSSLSSPSSESESDESLKQKELLSEIYQRRHDLFESVVKDLMDEEEDVNEEQKARIRGLVLDLSLNRLSLSSTQSSSPLKASPTGTLSTSDAFLAASSIDSTARIAGIQRILASSTPLAAEELNILTSLTLNPSEDVSVLRAVYTTSPSVLAHALVSDEERFGSWVDGLSKEVLPGAKRDALGLHLEFIVQHVLPKLTASESKMSVSAVVEKIFLPLLLLTKPRLKKTFLVWSIIARSSEVFDRSSSGYDLLKGCAALVSIAEKDNSGRGDEDGEAKWSNESLVQLNDGIADRIAQNVVSSDNFESHLALFVRLLSPSSQSHSRETRLVALLVVNKLLARLTGAHRTDFAYDVLEAVLPESQGGYMSKIADAVGDGLDLGDAVVANAALNIVRKPNSINTVASLEGAIILQISNIPPPSGTMHWLEVPDLTSDLRKTTDTRGPSFVRLARSLYQRLNSASSHSLSPLARHVHLALFSNIGNDTLLFLAGIWSSIEAQVPNNTAEASEGSQPLLTGYSSASFAALHHARAFVSAHGAAGVEAGEAGSSTTPGQSIDFQVILPAILIALQSSDKDVREAAVGLVDTIAERLVVAKKVDVYAYDRVYVNNAPLRYLEYKDLDAYLKALSKHGSSFVLDASHLAVFHHETLTKTSGEGIKEKNRKHRTLASLYSHAVAWDNIPSVASILRSLRLAKNGVELMMLYPCIEKLVTDPTSADMLPSEYVELLLETYNSTSKKEICDQLLPFFKTFLTIGRHWATQNASRLPLFLHRAEQLYSSLDPPRRVSLCALLIESAVASSHVWSMIKKTLPAMLVDVEVAVALLTQFKPATRTDEELRAQKRPKIEGANESDGQVQAVICLLEALQASIVAGSVDLAKALLDVLQAVSHNHAHARSDVDYVEQLLIGVLQSTISSIQAPVSSAALRVDVLVQLIGVSENPQTFNQALLLIGEMAKFASESIIHTVMPIFTFIDKNVIRRDDNFSFKVVQQAISNIVPVMVGHLRRNQTSGLQLYIDARDFLAIFTEASGHVPQHRRNKFLAHFATTLGADVFLPPVCMLLVDRVSSRVIRQSSSDRLSTLSPALNLLKAQPAPVQLNVLLEFTREAQRVATTILTNDNGIPTFLLLARDVGRIGASPNTTPRAQLLSLLYFVLHGWSQISPKAITRLAVEPYGEMLDEIIATLLDLATAKTGATSVPGLAEVAHDTLASGLTTIPVERFITAVQPVIASSNETLSVTATDLLADRVGSISSSARAQVSSNFVTVLEHLTTVLRTSTSPTTLISALRATRAIAPSASSQEDSVLTRLVPVVLNFEHLSRVLGEVLPTLTVLTVKLGPRLIPHLKTISAFCIRSMQTESELITDALAVLSTGLKTVPSFWGSELGPLVTGLLDVKLSASPPLRARIDSFMEVVASALPATTVLPTLVQLWDSDPTPDTLIDFLNLVERALGHASRSNVLERIRALFTLFLEALDLPSNAEGAPPELVEAIELQTIRAFLAFVTKLSETSFTPLFRRLQDWAWTAEELPSEHRTRRRITMIRVMINLLNDFKALMAPYAALLLPALVELLEDYARAPASVSPVLWSEVISLLDNSFTVEEGESLWNDKQLGSLLAAIVAQLTVQPTLQKAGRTDQLSQCIAHLAVSITREDQLKKLNLDILAHTRSEDARVRLLALKSSVESWTIAGSSLSPFVTDTITYIHECAEDENDSVAKEARRLKRIIEGIAGPIGDI